MGYRSERDALRARVEELEERLSEAKKSTPPPNDVRSLREVPLWLLVLRKVLGPAAALFEPAQISAPRERGASALRIGIWAFVLFWPVVFVPLTIPQTHRLTAPVLCNSGYERSYLREWRTGYGEAFEDHWQLICVSPRGEHAI